MDQFQNFSAIDSHGVYGTVGGTAAAVPPLFRPSDPALCGSHPLVTSY